MDVSVGSAIVCFCLLFADSGEKTPGVSGPTPPNMAETRASTHPEDPPSQSDTLHWSQVQHSAAHTGILMNLESKLFVYGFIYSKNKL